MTIEISSTSVVRMSIDWNSSDLSECRGSKDGIRVWALPLETSYFPTQIIYPQIDNRMKSKTVLEWTTCGNYIFTSIDKAGIRVFSMPQFAEMEEEDIDFAPVNKSDTWFENYGEFKQISKLQAISRETVNRIKEFASLEDNWDSYGAKRIEWSTIIKAIDFFNKVISENSNLPMPFVAPTPKGDIQFEWTACSQNLVNIIPEDDADAFEYIAINKARGKDVKTFDKAFSVTEMAKIVSSCMSSQYV